MSDERRGTYRKPTPAEAAHFAAVNKSWLKMQRRKRTRHAVQVAAAGALIVVVACLGMAVCWLVVMGIVVVFDGLAILVN